MLDGVTLRRACPADEPFLRAVFADDNEQLALLGRDVREILLDMEYRGHRSAQLAAHPNLERFIITVDGLDVGTFAYDISSGLTEIVELTITRNSRRHGIGTAVLSIGPAGPKSTTVGVRNEAARNLYARVGFTVAEETTTRVTLRCA